jgi:hypothetical protein
MGIEKNKRIVHLTGAGFASSFNGPSTNYITELMAKDKAVVLNDGGTQTLGNWLLDLAQRTTLNQFPNFEDILYQLNEQIHAAEIKSIKKETDLKSYEYLERHLEITSVSPYSPLYNLNAQNLIFKEEGNRSKQIHIVLKLAKKHYLETIRRLIRAYEKEMSEDTDLSSWISLLQDECSINRFYSTNYDESIHICLKKREQKNLDGFTKKFEYSPTWGPTFESDIKSILNDDWDICHFNLHGSIHWEYERINLDRYGFFKKSDFDFVVADWQYTVKDGHRVYEANNIVVGNDKLLENHLPPRRQYFSVFEKDIIDCDYLIVYGFSFSDDHINRILDNAINTNEGIHVIVVNREIDSFEELLSDKSSNWLSFLEKTNHFGYKFDKSTFKNISEGTYSNIKSNFTHRLTIYSKGIKSFLKNYREVIISLEKTQ